MLRCWFNRCHLIFLWPLHLIHFCWRHCTDGMHRWSSVQPVLKAWMLHSWHRLWTIVRWMHRCLSLTRRLNRCLRAVLTWFHLAPKLAPMLASVYPVTIGWTDDWASVKSVQLTLHPFVQFVAAIIWILEIYFISGLLLCFSISTADCTCHLDGGLYLASQRCIGHDVLTVNLIISMGPKNPTNMISQSC